MVGAIYTAVVGWLMLGKDLHGHEIMPNVGWRIFAFVCTLPAALALLLSFTVLPESPRFLMGQWRYREAVSADSTHRVMSSLFVDVVEQLLRSFTLMTMQERTLIPMCTYRPLRCR